VTYVKSTAPESASGLRVVSPLATESASQIEARNHEPNTERLTLNAELRASFKHACALLTSAAWARFKRSWIAHRTASTANRVDCWFSPVASEKQPLPAWALLAVDDELFEAWVRAARAHREAMKGGVK
jgi:hypothetical protein